MRYHYRLGLIKERPSLLALMLLLAVGAALGFWLGTWTLCNILRAQANVR